VRKAGIVPATPADPLTPGNGRGLPHTAAHVAILPPFAKDRP